MKHSRLGFAAVGGALLLAYAVLLIVTALAPGAVTGSAPSPAPAPPVHADTVERHHPEAGGGR